MAWKAIILAKHLYNHIHLIKIKFQGVVLNSSVTPDWTINKIAEEKGQAVPLGVVGVKPKDDLFSLWGADFDRYQFFDWGAVLQLRVKLARKVHLKIAYKIILHEYWER